MSQLSSGSTLPIVAMWTSTVLQYPTSFLGSTAVGLSFEDVHVSSRVTTERCHMVQGLLGRVYKYNCRVSGPRPAVSIVLAFLNGDEKDCPTLTVASKH